MQEFDINAPIEQQFTRDGRKVLAILNSGLDVMFPLAVFVEWNTGATSSTIEGKYYGDGTESDDDIITRKPDIKTYMTSYFNTDGSLYGFNYSDLGNALKGKEDRTCQLIIEVTLDPQTLEASAKTVWKKSEN